MRMEFLWWDYALIRRDQTSGQDGGGGRHTVPPHTTKRRTTNLKTRNNQNWQKIKLYESPTTKELKKKHSSRQVGGVEMGSQVERTHGKATNGGSGRARQPLVELAVPHLHTDKPGETTVEWDRRHNLGFQCREIKLQNLWLKKSVRVEAVGETPSLTGEFTGETHRVLECTQTHPPRNQHQNGPICLWVAVEVAESRQRAKQAVLFPLGLLPLMQHHNAVTWVAWPWWIPKALPLIHNR